MTHNERVLELLSDGQPHSHHELYSLHVIAHSRVSDLRKRGYMIEQWREGDLYLYRLLGQAAGHVDAAGRLSEEADQGGELRLSVSSSVSASGVMSAAPLTAAGDAGLTHGSGVPEAEVLPGQLSIEDVAA